MPADFDQCVKEGGKVRTVTMGKHGEYKHVCYDKMGRMHEGEVKMKKQMDKMMKK